jgi:hypothetical protein
LKYGSGDDSDDGSGGDSDEFEGELLSCVVNKVMGCIWLVELGVHSLMRVLELNVTGVDRGLWFVLMLLDWVSLCLFKGNIIAKPILLAFISLLCFDRYCKNTVSTVLLLSIH